jgi:hypothetical protein
VGGGGGTRLGFVLAFLMLMLHRWMAGRQKESGVQTKIMIEILNGFGKVKIFFQ